MKKDTKKIKLIVAMTITMLLGLVPFIILAKRKGTFYIGEKLGVIIIIMIALLMAVYALRRIRAMQKGEPLEDELSKKVLNMAATRSFYISLYWMLAIMLFEKMFAEFLFNSESLDASQALGGAITGMVIIFFFNWLYYQKKGVA